MNQYQSRKTLWIQCTVCRPGWFHVTCLGLRGATAEALRDRCRWRCGFACSGGNAPGTNQVSEPAETHPTSQGTPHQTRQTQILGLEPSYPGVKIVQRIPKGARHLAATKFANILDTCSEENTAEAWKDFFHFAWLRLFQPPTELLAGKSKKSLTAKIKKSTELRISSANPKHPCATRPGP